MKLFVLNYICDVDDVCWFIVERCHSKVTLKPLGANSVIIIRFIQPLKSMLLGTKYVFKQPDLLMFGLKLTFSLPYMTEISVVIRQWT